LVQRSSFGPASRLSRGCVAFISGILASSSVGCRIESDAFESYPRNSGVYSAATAPSATAAASETGTAGGSPGSLRREVEAPARSELPALSRSGLWAAWNSLRGDAYELDGVDRALGTGAPVVCNPRALIDHRGQVLPYRGAVRVAPAFRDRLVRFEQVVVDVAREVYGRAPARLRHFGAYSCRTTRNHTYRLSEHALGNALDVVGFDFGRAKKAEPLAEGLPRQLAGPFQVRVARHWTPDEKNAAAAVHGRFLHELAARLSERSDVFRGMIGPSRSDHTDHFHLDMGLWRYVYF
jgi:hypothetical protein